MYQGKEEQQKIRFSGEIISIQVRSTVWRYLTDNRTHREIGYNRFLCGIVEGDPRLQEEPEKERAFSVAISDKQLHKLQFHICDIIRGTARPRCTRKLSMRIITGPVL